MPDLFARIVIAVVLLVSSAVPIPPRWDETVRQRSLIIAVPSRFTYRLHSKDAFEQLEVCVDETLPDCDSADALRFVGPDVESPQRNEFRYHRSSGPSEMEGVFWFENQPAGQSVLMSFARTRQAVGGIATGETGSRDALGYVAAIRPRGDHNWALSYPPEGRIISSSGGNELTDAVYRLDLTKGTLDAPRKFMFNFEIRFFGLPCLRLYVFRFILYLLAQWSMELNDDPSHPDVDYYTGSVIWKRRSYFLGFIEFKRLVQLRYNFIQIIDRDGNKIQPAYDDFAAYCVENYDNRIYFYGLKDDSLEDFSCFLDF